VTAAGTSCWNSSALILSHKGKLPVVVPTVRRLFEGSDCTAILDIGSGTGDFAIQLVQMAGKVIAVEPSQASMTVPQRVCQRVQNVRYGEASLEGAANTFHEGPATSAAAVMTLMTAPDLRGLAKVLAALLQTRARFVAMLTHPCFWPRYLGYEGEPWFCYEHEIFIEAPFVISKCRTKVRTTHIHRPLEQYLNVLAEAGFRLDALAEPMPAPEVQALYPRPWEFPRFLGLRWEQVV
jgi:SAM-dependent methyltransferase